MVGGGEMMEREDKPIYEYTNLILNDLDTLHTPTHIKPITYLPSMKAQARGTEQRVMLYTVPSFPKPKPNVVASPLHLKHVLVFGSMHPLSGTALAPAFSIRPTLAPCPR